MRDAKNAGNGVLEARKRIDEAQRALDDVFYALESRGWTSDGLYFAAQEVGTALDLAQEALSDALDGSEE